MKGIDNVDVEPFTFPESLRQAKNGPEKRDPSFWGI